MSARDAHRRRYGRAPACSPEERRAWIGRTAHHGARCATARMVELVRQYAQLCGEGVDVLVCRSGAIAVGQERLGCPDLEELTTYKWIGIGKGHVRE